MNPNLLSTCIDLLSRILKGLLFMLLRITSSNTKQKISFLPFKRAFLTRSFSMIRRSLRNQIREPPYKLIFILRQFAMNKISSTLCSMSNDTTGSSYISHHLLVAMPGLLDPIFSKSVVYLAEHSGEGAMGIVINKPCELDLRALLTKLNLGSQGSQESKGVSEPVYYGGPIQQDRGFVLHEPASTWASTLKINEALALTSSKDILEATAKGIGPEKILVSLGYSGWGPGQLDTELASNSWLTIPLKDNKLLFDTPADVRFDEAFKILGIHPDNLSNVIGHA